MSTRGVNPSKQSIAEENRARVQRQRAEQRFMRGITSNYEVEHLQTLHEEVRNENREVEVTRRVSRRRVEIQPDAHEGFSELKRFGKGVRCVEVTQGGATIWTATDEGTIEIHSGNDGLLVHTVATMELDVQVEVMHSTETHIWVGLSDGTVQVYDHMVFLHITEGRFHATRITAFTPTFDNRIFSASADGVIVRWDTEAKSFEAMSKISTSLECITALAACYYRLYATSNKGELLCLDVENAQALSTIKAHEGSITAAVVVDGNLFTAGTDAKLQVWGCQDDTPNSLATIELSSPVAAFGPDPSSHRLLVGHEDGTIDLMRSTAEDNFSIERTFTEYQGESLKGLKSMTAVDSLKIWSLASNGVNKVWYSSKNQVTTAMEDTISSLKAVIKQDTVELDKWRTLVFRLQCINARRKLQLAGALEMYHQEAIRRRYVWNWRQYLRKLNSERRKLTISSRLAQDTSESFLRSFFSKWFRWYRTSQNNRLKTRYSDLLLQTSKRDVALFYFRKLQAFSRHVKLSLKRRDATRLLGRSNETFFLRNHFRKWLKYRQERKALDRKMAFAGSLFRSSNASLRRFYYIQWLKAAQRYVMQQRRIKFGESMLELTTRGLRLNAYQKWAKYVAKRRTLKRKMMMAGALIENTNRGLMARTYARWLLFRARRQQSAIDAAREKSEREVAEMREKYRQLQHIIDEKKALDALRKRVEEETDSLETRRLKYQQLQNEKNELSQQIADRDFDQAQRAKSVQEQMMSLMAALKAKVINFHMDFQLMHTVREKLRQNQPVTKVFLEAHQQVKRLVVEMTKKPHLQAEEWPLTQPMIHKLPSHSLNVLLTAIKTMIITFDVMDKETRDNLQSDVEIVLNAQWLLIMAEHCVSHRKKTLGHR